MDLRTVQMSKYIITAMMQIFLLLSIQKNKIPACVYCNSLFAKPERMEEIPSSGRALYFVRTMYFKKKSYNKHENIKLASLKGTLMR